MKDAEDQAFDELARKQGDWGGGFPAKRRMAADKQREWIGLTEEDFSAINQSCFTKLQAATSAESILKERNS
jgi:hypothetical protein